MLAVVATVTVLVLGPRTGALIARQVASSRIGACEAGAARGWLAWSARLDPGDYSADLLQAACHRQWNEWEKWSADLQEAERKGAPDEQLKLERKLGMIQSGRMYEGAEAEMGDLAAAGASPRGIATAFLYGYLVRDDIAKAGVFLENWQKSVPDEAHGDYLRGFFWRWQGNLAEAEAGFQGALAAQPGHELARAQLAELFEEKGRLDEALGQYVDLAIRSGGSDTVAMRLARVLRKLARLDEAQAVLAPLGSQAEPPFALQVETALIEFESGNYEEAERRFGQLHLDDASDVLVLYAAASTLAFRGKGADAERLFSRGLDTRERNGWIIGLRVRLASDPGNLAAAEELKRLTRSPPSRSLQGGAGTPDQGAGKPLDKSAAAAAELYARHCSACHGADGDGRGPAARHLFPRPRGLRTGKSKLVSTLNGVPTLEDVEQVLARGMPGTPMAAFDHLTKADRKLLAQEVLRLQREGVRDQITKALRQEEEEIDEADIRQAVQRCTTPGEPVRLPQKWPALGQAASRGKDTYRALGCNKCHGDDGMGAPDHPLFDDQGEPERPRDLVHEPFLGGRQAESIYLRIAAGMPGTAQPAAWNVPEGQLIELVDYIRWLAREPQRALANHERRLRATSRDYLRAARAGSAGG